MTEERPAVAGIATAGRSFTADEIAQSIEQTIEFVRGKPGYEEFTRLMRLALSEARRQASDADKSDIVSQK